LLPGLKNLHGNFLLPHWRVLTTAFIFIAMSLPVTQPKQRNHTSFRLFLAFNSGWHGDCIPAVVVPWRWHLGVGPAHNANPKKMTEPIQTA